MIAIVDYGAGNLVSVKKALDWLGYECMITADSAVVAKASRVILPGVGHFASTKALVRSGVQNEISGAIGRSIPFLGICVGMQWLFEGSAESPGTPSLAILSGRCDRFPATVKSPHVGWNSIDVNPSSRLFQGIEPASFVYFTHSFRAPICEATVACCEYGGSFSAAVERDNIFGVQFHPEKSGESGLGILRNFCTLPC
ncbi:MAG TPA: imidazole glycerol phosphate synthase subunit HisH [Candidatus Sulfotelmatobacter sp.]|jgi:glutamine amidotransferase|nr:imidazole glycerol phosphate synthase subunit HisH [Candidatus Sulfotelmatobacter sp.]